MAAIGVDIDDVMYPWFATAHELSTAAGITNGVQPTSWAPYDDYGCTREQWHAVLAKGAEDGTLYDRPPLDGSFEALQALKDAGHAVHLITARGLLENGHLIREHTVRWLVDAPHDSLTFSADKSIVRTDYMIDDNAGNLETVKAAGSFPMLIERPWNRGAVGFSRFRDLPDAVDMILHYYELPEIG